MLSLVEQLAPQHMYYKNTVEILSQLNAIKAAGGFKILKNPKVKIKLNASHAVVPVLRERLLQHGYVVALGSAIYDEQISGVIQEIQKENGFNVSADLAPDSGVWAMLSVSVDQRICKRKRRLKSYVGYLKILNRIIYL